MFKDLRPITMEMKPHTTLFMLTSIDGKISMGATSNMDFDGNLWLIPGVADGLYQYYELKQEATLWTLCSGKTQAKVGCNNKVFSGDSIPSRIALLDNNHLTAKGVRYLCSKYKEVYLYTLNANHPAKELTLDNLSIVEGLLLLEDILADLYVERSCSELTIQTGSALNARFLNADLIDALEIVVAPILVGGDKTPNIIGGN